MARINTLTRNQNFTHEGAPAAHIDAEQMLRRSVMSCLLWEKEFYEDGEEIAERIVKLARGMKDKPWIVSRIAIEARERSHLRHMPLLLLSVLAEIGKGHKEVAETIERVIQRADELSEFLAIHAKINKASPKALKRTLSAQIKQGIARAFVKFDEYQLAKYDRDGAVRLRDALFLCHAKPKDKAQARLWKRLVDNKLETPDTWEVELSAGADKRKTFERLLREEKLGYLALLRNLRNMQEANCDQTLVEHAILTRKGARHVLPFRYVAAARAAPMYESAIDAALLASIGEQEPLSGYTAVLVDISGSMDVQLSGRSQMKRMDAAAALAAVIPANKRVFSFSDRCVEVPARSGMAGVDAIQKSQSHSGTYLGAAVQHVAKACGPLDRLIVITDEQSHDAVIAPDKVKHRYMVNVASNKHGVGYGEWTHIDGWSEGVINFIRHFEAQS